MSEAQLHDVLIIGSGAAGLGTALNLPPGYDVAVLSKGRLAQGATNWAQGGIASVLADDDTFDLHEEDTIVAGAGLCHPDAVRFVVEHAPEVIAQLERYGIDLTKEGADDARQYHLAREGGHSRRRVVHAADATGRAVQACLQEELARRTNISVYENRIALDLIMTEESDGRRCIGVLVLDPQSGEVSQLYGRIVVLATGGASKVYLHATNPEGATGDGIAMAWRAGCRIANMEFTQFHPTCLYRPGAAPFLITEAMRGEGAHLMLPDGQRFMAAYHPMAELAPRDVVSRAIHREMSAHGLDCVFLDIRHKPAAFICEHFPTIHAHCLTLGLDITREPIPVVPAAHYTCGGIMTDLAARSDLAGLYAVGECSFTGLHGANRLASNSLLECLVFAQAAATDIQTRIERVRSLAPSVAPPRGNGAAADRAMIQVETERLRRLMWRHAGIVRSIEGLTQAAQELADLAARTTRIVSSTRPTPESIELRNLLCVADLIVRSALSRHESRGIHFLVDYPEPVAALASDTVLSPTSYPADRPAS